MPELAATAAMRVILSAAEPPARVSILISAILVWAIFLKVFSAAAPKPRSRQAHGRDIQTRVEISFNQAVFGSEVKLNLDIDDTCPHCKGTTAEPGYELKTCETCHGSAR